MDIHAPSRGGLRNLALVIIFLLLFILHINGFKIYGSPTLFENEVLVNPVKITGFSLPNLVQLENGETRSLLGVEFLPWLMNQKPPLQFLSGTNELVGDLEELGDNIVRIQIKWRCMYWCGNSWTPRFFPGHLPKYSKGDLGHTLISSGLARTVSFPMMSYDSYVEELSRDEFQAKTYAIGQWSDANVLTKCTDANSLTAVLQTPFEKAEWRGWGERQRQIVDSAQLLLRMSIPGTREIILARIHNPNDPIYLHTALARELARQNDLAGVDYLVNWIVDPSNRPPERNLGETADYEAHRVSIFRELHNLLGRSDDLSSRTLQYEAFRDWYIANRAQLHWIKERGVLGINDGSSTR